MDAANLLAALDEVGHLGFQVQMKARPLAIVLREKIEKVPLRHERNEFAGRRQVREIADRNRESPIFAPISRNSW